MRSSATFAPGAWSGCHLWAIGFRSKALWRRRKR